MSPAHHRDARPTTAGFLAAAVFALLMLGANLPSPLWDLWGARFGFGAIWTTILFAAYAVGIVIALIALAPLSDQAGRRPMLAITLGLAAVSTVLFLVAEGVVVLLIARLMAGLATGLATATCTAMIAELLGPKSRAARVLPAAANLGGLGLGPILSGVMAQTAPAPTRLVFWVYLGLLVLGALAALTIPETVSDRHRPQLVLRTPRLPADRGDRRAFLGACAFMCSGFMLSGLFGSLVPSFLRDGLHERNLAIVGILVGLLFLVGMAAQVLRSASGRAPDARGVPAVLIAGLILVEIGLVAEVLAVFIVGTVVAAVGFGLAAMFGIAESQRVASADHRADITATAFIAAYLGIAVSAIGAGVLDQTLGANPATIVIGVAVLLAVLAAARFSRSSTPQPEPAP